MRASLWRNPGLYEALPGDKRKCLCGYFVGWRQGILVWIWGSYFVRMAGILLMWGSTRGSEEVMLAPRFLGCTWNRPSLTERTRTDQQWMAFFLCPSFCIYLCRGHNYSFLASHYVVRSWLRDILTTNPLKTWSQISQYVELTKRFLKKKRKKSAQLGERNSWILRDISFLQIVLWDSDWDPKIALLPQYCIRSPEMFGNRDWN